MTKWFVVAYERPEGEPIHSLTESFPNKTQALMRKKALISESVLNNSNRYFEITTDAPVEDVSIEWVDPTIAARKLQLTTVIDFLNQENVSSTLNDTGWTQNQIETFALELISIVEKNSISNVAFA